MSTPLSAPEALKLRECEESLLYLNEAQIEAARALRTIHTERLYRASHASFAAFCESRNIKKSYGYDLVRFADLYDQLGASGWSVTNERQVRPLFALPEGERVPAWEALWEKSAQEEVDVTGKYVEEFVAGMLKRPARPKPSPWRKIHKLLTAVTTAEPCNPELAAALLPEVERLAIVLRQQVSDRPPVAESGIKPSNATTPTAP